MDCETIRQLGIADEYRAGRLSPDEADAYEEHYFACATCFDDLRFRDRVAGYLREEGARLFAPELAKWAERETSPDPVSPKASRRKATWGFRPAASATSRPQGPRPRWWNRTIPGPSWAWGLSLVATSIFVAAMVGTQVDHKDHLLRASAVVPHPYVPSELRSADSTDGFDQAMETYRQGDYATAATGLEACVQEAPDDAEVRFYLGVSQLLANRPMAAATSLQAAVRLTPTSSLYRWYYIQALLRVGHRQEANRQIDSLAAGADDFAGQARRLRSELKAR